jgi:hypothetical protein
MGSADSTCQRGKSRMTPQHALGAGAAVSVAAKQPNPNGSDGWFGAIESEPCGPCAQGSEIGSMLRPLKASSGSV